MAATEAPWVEELAKIKAENEELNKKLRDSQTSFHTLQNDYATINGKIPGLEAKVKVAKERASHEAFIREAAI